MRVLIAGGSGLIGREITAKLTKQGNDVFILSRSPDKLTGLPEGAWAIKWDGKTLQDWWHSITDCDVIINLTGENLSGNGILPTRWTKKRKEKLVRSRIDSGKILTEAITQARKRPSVFIQASGINYYDMYSNSEITEEVGPGRDFLANLSKEWEASSQPIESLGIRRVIIRNGVVLSKRGGALRYLLLPYSLFVGGKLGSGKQIYSWIHIMDEVEAILFLINNSQASGPFNLTSPNPVTNIVFGKTIANILKRPHYFSIPAFLMKIVLGEVASMVLEGQKVLPMKLLQAGYKFQYPVIEDALYEILK